MLTITQLGLHRHQSATRQSVVNRYFPPGMSSALNPAQIDDRRATDSATRPDWTDTRKR